MKKLFKFLSVAIFALSICAATLGYQYSNFLRTPLTTSAYLSAEGTVFVVHKGTSVYKIAKHLVEAGLLKSSSLFLFSVYTNGCWQTLKAGEYLIKPGSMPVDLIHQLRDGKVIQYALTIVPGWTFERLMLEIEGASKIQHALTGLSPAEIMAKLGHATEDPEGRFLPETYYYPAGTPDIAILQRSYQALEAKLSLLWHLKKRDSIFKTPYEALILASIIEKESSVISEYPEIAGVYTRRLAKNMPLQADPTLIYGVENRNLGIKANRNITKEMLSYPTPYNTYLKTGLPPTPIALPSAKALEAALEPKAGQTLYFVAKPEGKGHVFSENLSDHNVAVAAYRRRAP